VLPNQTANNTVKIVSCLLYITLQWESMNFTNVDVGTTGNAAPGNADSQYNITVEPTTTCSAVDIDIKGDDLYHTSNTNYHIDVGNVTWNTQNVYNPDKRLTNAWALLANAVAPNTNVSTFYWLDVPCCIASEWYNGTMYIMALEDQ
jgi:hypothetical protein